MHWITQVLLLDYSSTPIGTLALGKGAEVHIDVLPLEVLLVWQSLEVGKEISFLLLFVEEVVPLVTIASKRRQRIASASCRKSEGVKV